MAFHICLVEPEIPQNTGNIVRTCVATGAVLHLVRPLGFEVTDKHLKRAGLDYWQDAEVHFHDSFAEVLAAYPDSNFYYASTKGSRTYADVAYRDGDFLVFGRETRGLPEELLFEHYDACIRIPMIGETRSLNLANSVAVILYEALRQGEFEGLKFYGKLREY